MFAEAAAAWLWKSSIFANQRQLPKSINQKRRQADAAFFIEK
jgi:hypothetical protein